MGNFMLTLCWTWNMQTKLSSVIIDWPWRDIFSTQCLSSLGVQAGSLTQEIVARQVDFVSKCDHHRPFWQTFKSMLVGFFIRMFSDFWGTRVKQHTERTHNMWPLEQKTNALGVKLVGEGVGWATEIYTYSNATLARSVLCEMFYALLCSNKTTAGANGTHIRSQSLLDLNYNYILLCILSNNWEGRENGQTDLPIDGHRQTFLLQT